MLIRSAIFLATFGTKLQLKPTCNFEENLTRTRDIISKHPSFHLENLASRCNDVTSPTVEYAEALLAAMYPASMTQHWRLKFTISQVFIL
jgi:hypothetical protein